MTDCVPHVNLKKKKLSHNVVNLSICFLFGNIGRSDLNICICLFDVQTLSQLVQALTVLTCILEGLCLYVGQDLDFWWSNSVHPANTRIEC
jgi:hypothetical protein